jgi:hypothetical protein
MAPACPRFCNGNRQGATRAPFRPLVDHQSQNKTMAARATADRKIFWQLSERVATYEDGQSFKRPKMISMRLRRLVRRLSYLTGLPGDFRPRMHALSPCLSTHFRFDKTSSMIPALAPPDRAAEASGGAEDLVTGMGARRSLQPWPCVLAGRYDSAGVARGDSRSACASVISCVRCPTGDALASPIGSTDLANGLIGWDLAEQCGQDGSIRCPAVVCLQATTGADPATSDLNRPYFQPVRINAKMYFPPPLGECPHSPAGQRLTRSGRPMFLGKPLPIAHSFDPGAVNQKVLSARAGPIRDGDVQSLLTT